MIDFEDVWLPQIVRYAQLTSSGQLDAEWLGQAVTATSVTGPDELGEQMFDDLDVDCVWAERRDRNSLSVDGREAIDRFLQTLREIVETDASVLVQTDQWERARQAARAVVANVG